jgi:sterol desaturase/sphingolipid hydroxylase (fatty acid hydroxylase superfamily)
MVHHTDLDIDVTSGTRFHTVEILLSMGIKICVVFLLGAPAIAVLIFEIILNGTAMFNHSNITIPIGVDKIVRLLVVTPDMHRVHHSIIVEERNSNFGFNLSIWDRIFGTYRAQPEAGHVKMVIGLKAFREEGRLRLLELLRLPFTAGGRAS